jgi:hypothetical protein
LKGLTDLYHAAHLLVPKLPSHLEKIYGEICGKSEMSKNWFLGKEMEAKARPPKIKQKLDKFTDEIATTYTRIDMLMAKQLLVYARLNRFYM